MESSLKVPEPLGSRRERTSSRLWDQVVSGHAMLILDEDLLASPGRAVLTVPCDRPQRDLGAALEARRASRPDSSRSRFLGLAADRTSLDSTTPLAGEPEPERAWLLVEP